LGGRVWLWVNTYLVASGDFLQGFRPQEGARAGRAQAGEGEGARPVRTWDDIIVRAAIAVHWHGPGCDPAYPEHTIAIEDCCAEEALAHVVKGILDISGLRFELSER
jgi:hypothetical protein